MLGTNTVHFDIEALSRYKLDCVEVCLGREGTFEMHQKKVHAEIIRANQLHIPLSVHLPIELPERFTRDYLDAMFLESDLEEREIAFEMLELNLKELAKYEVEYFVLHFPGITDVVEDEVIFLARLRSVLSKMNDMARAYNVKVLLEYFGSNVNFYEPQMWIDEIGVFSNLGILVDTGHLYFASIIRGFEFVTVLEVLSEIAEAFHLWTTKGSEVYGKSEIYQKFKHIVPHIDQLKKEGWAFDTAEVLKIISKVNKPVIIEAAPIYMGEKYYKEGIRSVVNYINKC